MIEFDPLVIRAMAKWPDVPAVYGWLRLDRRGQWWLIDRGRPDFDEARDGLGSSITSPPIIDFIGRNYASDHLGRWFWQNGPQRVYVTLDCAPFVLRVLGGGTSARLVTHTGAVFEGVQRAAVGPDGEILLASDSACGVVHDLDAAALDLQIQGAATLLQIGDQCLTLEPCADPPGAFGFIRSPGRENPNYPKSHV